MEAAVTSRIVEPPERPAAAIPVVAALEQLRTPAAEVPVTQTPMWFSLITAQTTTLTTNSTMTNNHNNHQVQSVQNANTALAQHHQQNDTTKARV